MRTQRSSALANREVRAARANPCAAKAIRLILGDPLRVSASRACPTAERSVVNTSRAERKSAEVIVLHRRIPASTGRTEP